MVALERAGIAEGSLSKKAEFLTKYCNIKQNSSIAWLEYQTVENAGVEKTLEDSRDCYAAVSYTHLDVYKRQRSSLDRPDHNALYKMLLD